MAAMRSGGNGILDEGIVREADRFTGWAVACRTGHKNGPDRG